LSDERCPHLNGQGLCNIILSLGEGYLCEICREHPRFYQDTSHGKEVGLGMCCEEACRLILSHDPLPLVCIGECEGEAKALAFDACPYRDDMLLTLAEKGISYAEKRKRLCERYCVFPDALDDGDAVELLESLEYLDPAHRKAFAEYRADVTRPQETEALSERILSYFILRHCVAAENESELRAALCFSLFCETLIASIASKMGADTVEELIPICRTVSEEIEYSEENTEAIKTEFLFRI
jgi:lysine-N-methylase